MKRLLMGLVFALFCSGVVASAGPNEVRKTVQASMLVTGSIVVAPDGSVRSYVIDHPEKLPSVVVGLIEKNEKTWRFEPTLLDSQPVAAKANMSLRIVAKPVDKENYAISIAGAEFDQDNDKPGESISYKRRILPLYPRDAASARVTGTVYMLVLVDRQGQVENASIEVVNMTVVASDTELNAWRRVLGNAALSAVKHWTFNVPTTGMEAHKDHWLGLVPVNFYLNGSGVDHDAKYGTWITYVPGPKQEVPWLDNINMKAATESADAIADGALYQVGSGLQLTTSLNGT
ncbi:energy transducer TonB [Rhodanobacter sp. A1T4]|uniref:energy transducer TonB n=1 Tax=Rhodanobacter sp. A1T4 TaxID=2723087 RepID=UPI00160A4914|nr:energy transducer TonB [Rhodanobacter sp. A1T4]MBB6246801.1 TonB family protein [Rhodanobacter sp. A1T4]